MERLIGDPNCIGRRPAVRIARLATLAGEWRDYMKEYTQRKLLHSGGTAPDKEKKQTIYELQLECSRRIDANNIIVDSEIIDVIGDVMKRAQHRTHMYDMINWYDNVRFLSDKHTGRFKDDVLEKIRGRIR